MTHTPSGEELFDVVLQRYELLSVVDARSLDRQTLSDELEIARSTVDRVIRELRDLTLVESVSDGITTTLFASLLNEVYTTFDQHLTAHSVDGTDTPLWCTEEERRDVMRLVASRVDLLECARVPHDKRDLVDSLDVSRSTVDRAIRKLEAAGLVERTTNGYETTPVGCRVTAQYGVTIDEFAHIISARSLLDRLPRDSPIEAGLLVGADVTVSEDTTPYRLPKGVRTRLVAADQVRLFIPSLTTPQLLDCCNHGTHSELTGEFLLRPSLFEMLIDEFPGPLADMATAGSYNVSTTTTAPARDSIGVILSESDGATTVTVIVYHEQGTIHGTVQNATDAAIRWAESYYDRMRTGAKDVTDRLCDLSPEDAIPDDETVDTTDRIEREAEGFIRLTPEYFAHHPPSPPSTGWRTGFEIVDVHAGYTIDREIPERGGGPRRNLTDDLSERLGEGTNLAVLGPPGSGKSTVCKTIACRWYEHGRGPVFYRRNYAGSFTSAPALSAQLRATDGHALVVVEDAVRADASAVFRLVNEFRGDPTVTFLLDSRTTEWDDSETLPIDAKLDAVRTRCVETVTVPSLDETEAQRFVHQFEQITDHDLDTVGTQIFPECRTEIATQSGTNGPGAVLVLLHRLALYADPLSVYDSNTPTTLVENVQRTLEAIRQAGDLVLDVGVFVNLLNAAGIDVTPALVCALATTEDEESPTIDDVRRAISSLDGTVIFPRKDADYSHAPYRMVHEEWSVLLLEEFIATAETEHEAHRRVGRCITALLSLADDPARRDRIRSAFFDSAPAIDRIETHPGDWADATVERLFHLGRRRRDLTVLFGRTGESAIDLPEACSLSVTVDCTRWRALMANEAGNLLRAEFEFEALNGLAETVGEQSSEWEARLRGQRLNGLGNIAFRRSDFDTAESYFTDALDCFRDVDDRCRLADTRMNLAGLLYSRGDLESAETQCRACLSMYRDLDNGRGTAKALYNLGVIIGQTGTLEDVITQIRECLELNRRRGDRRDESFHLSSLGEAIAHRGDIDTGKTCCLQALELARKLGTSDCESKCLKDLGHITRLQGDLDTAETLHLQSLCICRENGDRRTRATNRMALGVLARERCAFELAVEHCNKSLAICRELEARIGEAHSLAALAEIEFRRGSLCTAKAHTDASLTVYQETGHRFGVATCHWLLGQIARVCDTEQLSTARDHLSRALSGFRDGGNRFQEARTLTALGHLALDRDAVEHARERFGTAIEIYNEMGAIRSVIETAEELVAVCESLGDVEAARSHCETATALAQETPFVDLPVGLVSQRSRLEAHQG